MSWSINCVRMSYGLVRHDSLKGAWGCLLLPLLYVLHFEELACNIRSNPRIMGLFATGSPPALSSICHYVDDTTMVVTSDNSIRAILDTYRVLKLSLGSRLNQFKSRGLSLGC